MAQGTFGVSPLPSGEGKGEGVPTAYRPPLYPLLLTGCVALGQQSRVAIGLLHLALGAATVGLVLTLGRWWGLDRRAAALAALLVACDPILLHWSTQVMTETLATFLAVAGLLALTWAGQAAIRADVPSAAQRTAARRAALAGGILGLGALCRPTLLLWAVAAAVAFWFHRKKNSRGLTAPGSVVEKPHRELLAPGHLSAAFVFGVAVVLSPWAVRNQLQFGRPIVTTTHGGYTLLLANNPEFYQWLRAGRWGSVWQAGQFNAAWNRRKPANELAADRLAYAEAWQTIRHQPTTFADACLVRLGRFWSSLPHQIAADESLAGRLSRWAVAVWYVAEFLLAAVLLASLARRGLGTSVPSAPDGLPSPFPLPPSSWLWGLLLVACLTAVHTFYWTDMRMRAPLMPVVALAAASGLFCFRQRRVARP